MQKSFEDRRCRQCVAASLFRLVRQPASLHLLIGRLTGLSLVGQVHRDAELSGKCVCEVSCRRGGRSFAAIHVQWQSNDQGIRFVCFDRFDNQLDLSCLPRRFDRPRGTDDHRLIVGHRKTHALLSGIDRKVTQGGDYIGGVGKQWSSGRVAK